MKTAIRLWQLLLLEKSWNRLSLYVRFSLLTRKLKANLVVQFWPPVQPLFPSLEHRLTQVESLLTLIESLLTPNSSSLLSLESVGKNDIKNVMTWIKIAIWIGVTIDEQYRSVKTTFGFFLRNFPSAVEILPLRKRQCQLNQQSSNRSKPTTNLFGLVRLQKNSPFYFFNKSFCIYFYTAKTTVFQ